MGVTEDLMTKISSDVGAAMRQTLALAGDQLPIAMAGGAAAIGTVGAVLEKHDQGIAPNSVPDPDCILLAALLCARLGIKDADPITQAYADFDTLKKAVG